MIERNTHLNDLENDCIFTEDAEYVKDAHHDPRLHRRQALRLRRVCGDRVEDVHQDEKQGHKKSHPA